MKKIEDMLFGIFILLIVIIIHLCYKELLLTDFIGIIGVIFTTIAYFKKRNRIVSVNK
jgi:hypothetical protein